MTILPDMGKLRIKLAKHFKQLDENLFKFCWITDFPVYEYDDTIGEVQFSHNP